MKFRLLYSIALVIPLLTAACAGIDLSNIPGLQAIPVENDQVSGPLRRIADKAEQQTSVLDVIEIRTNGGEGILVVNALLNPPDNKNSSSQPGQVNYQELILLSVDALVEATLTEIPEEAVSLSIFLMRIEPVTSLNKGPAMVGETFGVVQINLRQVAGYTNTPRDLSAIQAFMQSDAVNLAPISQLYDGTPNHPIRAIENE